jgi:hypothetical protein
MAGDQGFASRQVRPMAAVKSVLANQSGPIIAMLARSVTTIGEAGSSAGPGCRQEREPRSWATAVAEPTNQAGLDGNGPTYRAQDIPTPSVDACQRDPVA